ncbi:hypothetical protein DOY81_005724, partial [Sarcophaga bullata]
LVQKTAVANADGLITKSRDSTTYESDNESEKPILLELGAASHNATELTNTSYASDYPLDIQQLNNVYSISSQHSMYHADTTAIFNNPYNDSTLATSQLLSLQPSHSLTPLSTVPYSPHIPQTIHTWSTPAPVTNVTPLSNTNTKLLSDIVPPPICMSYPNAREHTVIKETNPSWKEKALQSEKDYKKTACDRERTRMRDMNRAFDSLRAKLPISKPNGKKYSKIESLRIAINYINHLQQMLKGTGDITDQSINNYTKSNQNSAEFLTELNVRRRTHSFRYENNKKYDKLENLDETRSTWSDGYIPNGEEKWE